MNNACQCAECKSYCEYRPGWPTPQEAQAALDAGYAYHYMLDWWVGSGSEENIYLICPAVEGSGGDICPWWPTGRCELYTPEGLCEIHTSGFKPVECCEAHHARKADTTRHGAVAKLWDTDLGRAVVERWKKIVSFGGSA